ncbi:hypothetical protein NA78x_004128 [Anatilimnocola sp. NA78]|uniref:hypothetical protein n=1 Tax=Anatilimnocola sp. NA78 TaxID=3415683 RepID=UPI003CE45A2E
MGCAPEKPQFIPVRGELFYQAKPASGAMVQFTPTANATSEAWPSGYPRGEVKADGSFEIGTENSADGAPVGEYIVTVTWMVTPGGAVASDPEAATVDKFQGKYQNPAKSELKATVTPLPTTLPRIDLK